MCVCIGCLLSILSVLMHIVSILNSCVDMVCMWVRLILNVRIYCECQMCLSSAKMIKCAMCILSLTS